jgi:tetratricopeptide (TPR) repeat protein
MNDSSIKMKKAFDEGRFLDVVQARNLCKSHEQKLMLGISLFRLGRTQEAFTVLSRVSEKTEQLAKVFYYLALVHKGRGDEETARSCLRKYLAFYPDDDEALDILETRESDPGPLVKEPSVQLARVYAQQGHYEQALDIYVQVEKMTGLDDEALKDARQVENLYIMKTLQGWLEKAAER